MSSHYHQACCDACERDGTCSSCDFRQCEQLGEELQAIDAQIELIDTVINNGKSISAINHQIKSLTGHSPAPDTEDTELTRTYRELLQRRDEVFDQMASAGCRYVRASR